MVIRINQDLCTNCGICGDVCHLHIPVTTGNGDNGTTTISSERIGLCMECGHCVALCPHSAIEVDSLSTEEFAPVEALDIDEDQLLLLLRQRRSIRNYKDKPVPRQVINRMIEAAHSAPTGTGTCTTGVIVIDNPTTLATFSELVYELYEGLEKGLMHPIGRRIAQRRVKRDAGEKNLRALQDFVMPKMFWYIRWYREGRSNEILRNCPVLMLFHNPIYEPMGEGNCIVSAFHAIHPNSGQVPYNLTGLIPRVMKFRFCGDCLQHALVCRGRIHGAVDTLMQPWDSAAIIPCIEEAGGITTTLSGHRKGIVFGGSLLTSCDASLHDQVLGLLQSNTV